MFKASLAGTLLVCMAIGQSPVAMPAHNAIYNGFTRGWNVTAQTDFAITELDLPTDAFQPGDTASFLIKKDGIQVHHSFSVGALPHVLSSPIPVFSGEELVVLGCWSPANPSFVTAHNSEDSAGGGVYQTNIQGVAHTFYRAGQQWDIGSPTFGGSSFSNQVGNLGRVFVTATSIAGFATKTNYGDGCLGGPRMVHEIFPSASPVIDLVNTSQSMIYQPNPNTGGNYLFLPGFTNFDPNILPTAIDLVAGPYTASSSGTWDDASTVVTLGPQFGSGFSFPNDPASNTTLDITINSNGKVYLGNTSDASFATQGSNYGSIAPFSGETGAGLPVFAVFNCDLDPTTGGNIWVEDPSPNGGIRITWQNILNWAGGVGTPVANDFQLELIPGGQVTFAYGSTLGNSGSGTNDAIVGYSAGGNQEVPPQEDWSNLPLTGYESGNGLVPLALNADARPVMGSTINLITDNVPGGSPFMGVLYGLQKFDPGIPLASLGMAGCFQYASNDTVRLILAPSSPQASDAFAVPNIPAFAGVAVKAQAAVYSPGAIETLLGAGTSNGVELVLDIN